MTDHQTNREEHETSSLESPAAPHRRFGPRTILAATLVGAAALGAGATAIAQKGPRVTLVALTPEPVSALKDGTMAAVKGDVAEIFGNKFVLQDDSGRALVETGRRDERSVLVGKGEAVTVQGRFERGFLRAAAITHADGHIEALDPPPPPPMPPGGPRDHGGPDGGPRPPT